MDNINYPLGAMQAVTGTMADPPVLDATIVKPCILTVSTTAFDKAFTLNLGTLGAELKTGDLLLVKFLSNSTGRVMTLGTGFTSNNTTVTGIASKWCNTLFMFNGSTFDRIGSLAA